MLISSIINCDIENNFDYKLDHLSILTRLELTILKATLITRRNFNKINDNVLRETLIRIITTKEILNTPFGPESLIKKNIDSQIKVIINSI